jgi:ketosteroid isomerase-like protein
MSQENVELVQASYAAFARGDLAYILDASDPDIEVVEPTELPDGSSYRGHQGLLDALDDWGGEWADIELEVERITGVGDRVVSLIHQRAAGQVERRTRRAACGIRPHDQGRLVRALGDVRNVGPGP